MIVGIGTDILQLSRLHALPLRRLQRLSSRILTANETRLLANVSVSGFLEKQGLEPDHHETIVRFLGVRYVLPSFLDAAIDTLRWAAKEALYKAVYPYHKLYWKDIELLPIQNQERSSPKLQVTFTKPLHLTVDGSTIPFLKTHLSISHDGGFVIAMTVVEGT